MTEAQRKMLALCKEIFDAEDRSTEYMLQHMQDVTGVDWWEMMDWLHEQAEEVK